MACILIISSVFYPDTASVSQHMTDLAEDLCHRGHDVEVLSSRYAYEDPIVSYPLQDCYRGVSIRRLWQTRFSKSSPFGRIINFVTFNGTMLVRLLMIRKGRYDAIIGTTVPPFLSYIGLLVARFKHIRYCFYAMDLQPELAFVSGYLSKDSPIARLLMKMSDYIYRKSDLVVALDRFMSSHIIRRGARSDKVKTIPVWPVIDHIYEGSRQDNPFRREMGFGDKTVVMYSGNMSVVHPLNTLLEAAAALMSDERFLFVFIGGGVAKKDVETFKNKYALKNILLLPFQPREYINVSLGSADLQVVIHGNGCTGYTHPNKIYGAMFIGKPILYIGPTPSHISDIFDECTWNISVQHGEVDLLADELRSFAELGEQEWERMGKKNREYAQLHFTRSVLCGRLIQEIERILI